MYVGNHQLLCRINFAFLRQNLTTLFRQCISKTQIDIYSIKVEDAQVEIRHFAIEMIQLDPRPAYQKRQIPVGPENVGKKFGLTVKNFDVKYEITKEGFLITAVLPIIE